MANQDNRGGFFSLNEKKKCDFLQKLAKFWLISMLRRSSNEPPDRVGRTNQPITATANDDNDADDNGNGNDGNGNDGNGNSNGNGDDNDNDDDVESMTTIKN